VSLLEYAFPSGAIPLILYVPSNPRDTGTSVTNDSGVGGGVTISVETETCVTDGAGGGACGSIVGVGGSAGESPHPDITKPITRTNAAIIRCLVLIGCLRLSWVHPVASHVCCITLL
jgi:hypothetical protein